jgi:hypothetical protein
MSEQDLRQAFQNALKPPKPRKPKAARPMQAACLNGGKSDKRDVQVTETPNGLTTLVAARLASGQAASVRCTFTDCGGALWTWKENIGGVDVRRAARIVLPNSTTWNVLGVAWGDAGAHEGNSESGYEVVIPFVAKVAG